MLTSASAKGSVLLSPPRERRRTSWPRSHDGTSSCSPASGRFQAARTSFDQGHVLVHNTLLTLAGQLKNESELPDLPLSARQIIHLSWGHQVWPLGIRFPQRNHCTRSNRRTRLAFDEPRKAGIARKLPWLARALAAPRNKTSQPKWSRKPPPLQIGTQAATTRVHANLFPPHLSPNKIRIGIMPEDRRFWVWMYFGICFVFVFWLFLFSVFCVGRHRFQHPPHVRPTSPASPANRGYKNLKSSWRVDRVGKI